MKKILLSSVLIICISLGAYLTYQKRFERQAAIEKATQSLKKKHAGMSNMSTPVEVLIAKKRTIYKTVTVPGTIKFSSQVPVQNQSAGVIKTINFNDGDLVQKNKLLISLDTQIAKENLQKAKATYDTTKTSYERKKAAGFAISKEELNAAKLSLEESKADYHNAQKTLLNMNVIAPMTGTIQSSTEHYGEGTYINANTLLANISSNTAYIVQYYLTASYYDRIALQSPLFINLPNNKKIKANVTFIDTSINNADNTFLVKANIQSNMKGLVDGLGVTVTQSLLGNSQYITLPEIALHADSQGNFVYTLNKNNVLQKTYVKVGELLADGHVAIVSGINDNTTVVIHGQQLKAGKSVKINNTQTNQ